MPDYNQLLRNIGYGALHRPAQLTRWFGGLFQNEAAPIGQAIVQFANEVDAAALEAFQPYVPPLPTATLGPPPGLNTGPAIGQVTGCLGYDPTTPGGAGLLLEYRLQYPNDRFELQWHWHGWWGCWSIWRTA